MQIVPSLPGLPYGIRQIRGEFMRATRVCKQLGVSLERADISIDPNSTTGTRRSCSR